MAFNLLNHEHETKCTQCEHRRLSKSDNDDERPTQDRSNIRNELGECSNNRQNKRPLDPKNTQTAKIQHTHNSTQCQLTNKPSTEFSLNLRENIHQSLLMTWKQIPQRLRSISFLHNHIESQYKDNNRRGDTPKQTC